MNNIYDCLIIGFGPCGIGAAIKLQEVGIKFAIIEKGMPGGKVNIAPRVDNYPHHEPISGPDLAMEFFSRANEANIPVIYDEVKSLTKEDDLFTLICNYETYKAKIVLVATGTKEMKLDLPNEDKMFGHGLSYCAICDGHFFKGQDIALIGDNSSALKEALYLANIAKHLYIINKNDSFKGVKYLVDKLNNFDNVTFLSHHQVTKLLGDDKLSGIIIKDLLNNEDKVLEIPAIFPIVGEIPNTEFINIPNVLDSHGTIPVNKELETSVTNLFAGGDVLPRDIRQIYLAEHDGQVAANSIIKRIK